MKRFILFILFSVLSVTFYACEQDEVAEVLTVSSDPNIAAAKAWFDKVGYGKNNRIAAGTKSKNKTPRWDKGESYQFNGETVVELPLEYETVQGPAKTAISLNLL